MAQAMDALEVGDVTAGAACRDAWLETYGMEMDAAVTDVVGTLQVSL